MEKAFAAREAEAEAAGRTGLGGLLEVVSGTAGSGRLFDVGTCVVPFEVVMDTTVASGAAFASGLAFASEYFIKSSPILALRRLIGMRFMRLSMRDRRSED